MSETVDTEVIMEEPKRRGRILRLMRNSLLVIFLFLVALTAWEIKVREPALRWIGVKPMPLSGEAVANLEGSQEELNRLINQQNDALKDLKTQLESLKEEARSGSSGAALTSRTTERSEGESSDSALMEVGESDLKSISLGERAVLGMKYKLLEERSNAARDKARQMLRELKRIEREEEKRRRAEQALLR